MAFPIDNETNRTGFLAAPRYQRDASFGLGSIVATVVLLMLAALLIGSLIKQSKMSDPIHTGGIHTKHDAGKNTRSTPCIIYSDGTSEGC